MNGHKAREVRKASDYSDTEREKVNRDVANFLLDNEGEIASTEKMRPLRGLFQMMFQREAESRIILN